MAKYHYVYALTDPRKFGALFYIGKGSGDRKQAHFRSVSKNSKNKKRVIGQTSFTRQKHLQIRAIASTWKSLLALIHSVHCLSANNIYSFQGQV